LAKSRCGFLFFSMKNDGSFSRNRAGCGLTPTAAIQGVASKPRAERLASAVFGLGLWRVSMVTRPSVYARQPKRATRKRAGGYLSVSRSIFGLYKPAAWAFHVNKFTNSDG